MDKVRHSLILLSLVLLALAACNGSGTKSQPKPQPKSNTQSVAMASAPAVLLGAHTLGGATDTAEYVGLDHAEPFYLDAEYASVLVPCVTITQASDSCALGTLPFLVSHTNHPSIEDVMSRVVVSHRWMGERFFEALHYLPADILQLFRSVTAIVIADDIRPSYFSTSTGAIYLDPQLLWQTVEEKAVFQWFVDQSQAFGSGQTLRFRSWSRYVKNGQAVVSEYSAFDGSERSIDDVLLPLAALLFHELAHANDFFPSERVRAASGSEGTVYELAGRQIGFRASDALYEALPLHSEPLRHLAEVMYQQEGMYTVEELSRNAQEMGAMFDLHPANDDYAFLHQFEDAAMLFEAVMMHYHFHTDRDVAFVYVPSKSEGPVCDDYKVAWGMRNRFARPEIQNRAQIIMDHLLPKLEWPAYFASLSAPDYLPVGEGWCATAAITFDDSSSSSPLPARVLPGVEPLSF